MADHHVHDVMNMMLDTKISYTRESLTEAMVAAFGESATFHSCSEDGMDIKATVEFLEARGKFVPAADGFTTSADKMCSH